MTDVQNFMLYFAFTYTVIDTGRRLIDAIFFLWDRRNKR